MVSNQFDSYEPEELKAGDKCELVWAKLKVQGSKDLYIGSFYRPPDNNDPEYLDQLQKFISEIYIPCTDPKWCSFVDRGGILTWQT